MIHRLLLLCLLAAGAAADEFTKPWFTADANRRLLGAERIEDECCLRRLSAEGGAFHPDEPVEIAIAAPADPKHPYAGGVLLAVPFNLMHADPSDTGFVYGAEVRRLALTEGVPTRSTPLAGFRSADGMLSGRLDVAEAYGLYAILLRRPAGETSVLGAIARVPRPQRSQQRFRHIMSEWILTGDFWADPAHPADWNARARSRLGIGLARLESGSGLADPAQPFAGTPWMQQIAAARAAGIRVMITLGAHQEDRLPKQDGKVITRVLPAQYDDQLREWYRRFTAAHWSGGDSGLWALEHWNEPWEPDSISGWNADSRRYRQLLAAIHDGAKAAAPAIMVMGCGSVMNSEDKLLSGDSRADLANLDAFTDHYVSLTNSYGARLAASLGKVSGETETWGAHSQVLVVQFLCQFLSNGERWLNPCSTDMVWSVAPGPGDAALAKHGGLLTPMPAAVAIAAWNALINDRPFRRLVFTTHAPYLYQFGEGADARFVLCGKLSTTGSGNLRDYPWWQMLEGPDGTIAIPDPGGRLHVADLNGNPVRPDPAGVYHLTADAQSWFVWTDGDPQTVIDAVRGCRIAGLRQVHIAPQPIAGSPAVTFQVHNVLNRPLAAAVAVEVLGGGSRFGAGDGWTVSDDGRRASAGAGISLQAGARTVLSVPLLRIDGDGVPLRFSVTPVGGTPETWDEVVCSGVIAHATPADAAAWARIPGAVQLRAAGQERRSVIEEIWLPTVKREPAKVPARRGSFKLAWDDKALHVWAAFDGRLQAPRPRLAARDDEAYFYGQPEAHHVYRRDRNMIGDLPFNGQLQFGFDVDRADQAMVATHDLRYPVDDIPERWQAIPDTDYEFAIYPCADGKPELWCLLAPGIPRGHYFPRQERGAANQHAVQAATSIETVDGQVVFQAAIPWSELGGRPWPAGSDVGTTWRFNGGDGVRYGEGAGAVKTNGLSLHPYWQANLSSTLRWTVLP